MATRRARTALYIGPSGSIADRARRIAIAASFELQAASSNECGAWWRDADVVLINAEDVHRVTLEDPVRRDDVLVLGDVSVEDAVWRDCVSLGAEDVVLLEHSEAWLVDRLGLIGGDVQHEGLVVGVLGVAGGSGASTVAAGLAVATNAAFGSSMIVDLDGFGGGYDLQLGVEELSGLSWHELADISGRISGDSLRQAVQTVEDIAMVGFARDNSMCETPEHARRAVLLAARQSSSLTVVDIPKVPDLIREVRPFLDVFVLVGTADVRGALATRSVLQFLIDLQAPTSVAVRSPHRQCLPDDVYLDVIATSESTGVWWLSEVKGIDRRLRHGEALVRAGDRFVGDCLNLIEGLQELRQAERPRRVRQLPVGAQV